MYLIHRELPVNHNRNETTVIVSLNVNLIHKRRNFIFFSIYVLYGTKMQWVLV